jgi:D-3-phosphoglycerate dehydrogenase / 2-oxoglutarate reductase
MRILAADSLDASARRGLEAAGFAVLERKGLAPEGLTPEMAGAEILIVRSTLVPAEAMARLPDLRLILRAGAGTDTIDIAAAQARGIQVSNTPGKNADAVAELALGLLLCADRKIIEGTLALRQGKWSKGALGQGMGLKGRRLGLVGFGAVAQAMARKGKGLEMEVLAWSRRLTPEAAARAGVGFAADLEALARASDAVSVHVASTSGTRNLIGAAFFAQLRPGALFVNTSRGEVVDGRALAEAIRTRGLRAGSDVFAGEPKVAEAAFADAELAALLACTPHLGASTDQAGQAVAEEVVRIAMAFRTTGSAPNAVLP